MLCVFCMSVFVCVCSFNCHNFDIFYEPTLQLFKHLQILVNAACLCLPWLAFCLHCCLLSVFHINTTCISLPIHIFSFSCLDLMFAFLHSLINRQWNCVCVCFVFVINPTLFMLKMLLHNWLIGIESTLVSHLFVCPTVCVCLLCVPCYVFKGNYMIL